MHTQCMAANLCLWHWHRRGPRGTQASPWHRCPCNLLWLQFSGEQSVEELAHLPINDAFALQEEEANGYFCSVESEMKDLKGGLIIKGDKSK